jgi:CBS-domain-containing membrane protein
MSEAYASNKIVPISEPIPDPIPDHNTVTYQNKCTTIILEGIGWAGSILVLCPYVVTFEKTIDFVLNTLGATGLLIVCIKSKQYQSIIINTAWIIGGIYKYYANS